MPSEYNDTIKLLLKSDPLKNTNSFYNQLVTVTKELSIFDPKKINSITKILNNFIPKLLRNLVTEPLAYNREQIIAFLDTLSLTTLSNLLFESILQALLEALHWDGDMKVKEGAIRLIYDNIAQSLKAEQNKEKCILFYKFLYNNNQKFVDIYYKEIESTIKYRIAAILSMLSRELFSKSFADIGVKERSEVYRAIFNIIIDTFYLKKLEYPRRDIILSLENMLQMIKEKIEQDTIKYELISDSIKSILFAYDSLPRVYHAILLEVLYQLAVFLGEALSEDIIVKFILLSELDPSESTRETVSNYLNLLAQKFDYGYKKKILSMYELKVKQQKEKLIPQRRILPTHPKNCPRCNYPITINERTCPGCGKEILKCSICKLPITNGEKIGYCSYCEVKGHLHHFQEWVKTQGKCPCCLHEITFEGIVECSRE